MRFPSVLAAAVLLLALTAADLAAVQLQDVVLTSPITGKKFAALILPPNATSVDDPTMADMGADDDGCRHTSGLTEYDYYVITDPYSYFSALAVEWDDRGRFLGDVGPDLKDWVIKEYNGDFQIDRNTAYKIAASTAKARGEIAPDRDTFVMSQSAIPVFRKYQNAISCYEKRGARSAVLAKLALTGAWALRVRFNVPISNDQLVGGIEEINDRLGRRIKDGDSFSLTAMTDAYRDIYGKPEVKTDEAILLAGLVYHGFLVRGGDPKAADDVLSDLLKRFEKTERNGEMIRGLVRERRESYRRYRALLEITQMKFTAALREEEFSRPRLPEVLLVIAESLRRTDHPADAAQWYLTLGQMAETQPKLRAEIRASGKAPGPEAPYPVQLGWIADNHLLQLKQAGVEVGDAPTGANAGLQNAILNEGFGTGEYKNPAWKPVSGATQKEALMILNEVGKSVLVFRQKLGDWPATLDEMWTRDVVRDRNLVNRFRDPVSGDPLLYERMSGDLAQRTVLVAMPAPVTTSQGPRYGAYLADNQIVWSEKALKPGDILAK